MSTSDRPGRLSPIPDLKADLTTPKVNREGEEDNYLEGTEIRSVIGDRGNPPIERIETGPPFHTRAELVRHMARVWPAFMLTPSFRRTAARDPLLEWDPDRKSYRLRRANAPAPAPGDRDSVGEGGGHES